MKILVKCWLFGFLLVLAMPLMIFTFGQLLPASVIEHNSLAKLPERPTDISEWKDFPGVIDKYISDNFPKRSAIVSKVFAARYVMGATRGNVMVGADGWLFYTGGRVVEQVTGEDIHIDRLESMVDFVERIYKESSQRKIKFLFIVAPNKHTIYREKMPSKMQTVPAEQERTILLNLMQDRNIPTVDLVPILREARTYNQVYWKTDTHWNELGSYIAFNAIVDEFGYGGEGVEINKSFVTYNDAGFSGDLARMLGLDALLTEPRLEYRPPRVVVGNTNTIKRSSISYSDTDKGTELTGYELEANQPGPTILVIGDSFATFATYFMGFAKKVVFVHHSHCRFDWNEVYKYAPDLILYQTAERYVGC